MERYFIPIIVVTVIGVTTQKKDGPGTNFIGSQHNERATPAFTASENSADVLTSYTRVKTIAEVIQEKTYKATVYESSIPKMIKNWCSYTDKTPGGTNPCIFYNILRSSPVGEPCFLE